MCAPSRPRPDSILARLARLAVDIFAIELEVPESHPGSDYRAVIRDAASAVLNKDQEPSSIAQDPLGPAFQSLFELLDDTMYDWPNLYNESAPTGYDIANIWNPH